MVSSALTPSAGTPDAHGVSSTPTDPVARSTTELDALTGALPSGERRPPQIAMCQAVARALATGRHLIVQAGTGTGKSLAYAVPAAASHKTVVISTATKALQDQLAGKDLPIVAGSTRDHLRFAVLKGRANYICRQRVDELAGNGIQQEFPTEDRLEAMGVAQADEPAPTGGLEGVGEAARTSFEPKADEGREDGTHPASGHLVDQVRSLVQWADRTDSGDRGDLPFEPTARAWSMVSVGPRECPGAFNCPAGARCFAERARATAAQADIIVVNTHLYGAHLASGGSVLPGHDVVIFDEAHELEEIMTASLGVEIAPGRFGALARAARGVLDGEEAKQAIDGVAGLTALWQDTLAGVLGDRLPRVPDPGSSQRGTAAGARSDGRSIERRDGGPGSDRPGRSRSEKETRDVRGPGLDQLVGRSIDQVRLVSELLRQHRAGDPSAEGRRSRTAAAAANLAADLHEVATRGEGEVAWVGGSRRWPVLHLSPIDVGPVLADQLWGNVTAVLTSATIPPRLASRIGLEDRDVDTIDVGSPFDYRSHALLYVARHLPDRRDPSSETALHDELFHLVDAAGGRTLALFTSRRATEAAAEALRPRLPFPVLVQDDLPKARLLEQFAREETSCLFATLGFWQGVDVPGRALSLVTIDRLPFARPDEPLTQARRERAGERAFHLVDLPRAATLLAQGAGRLIRTAEDHGVVAVLDSRLATARYRNVLLAALPPMRRTTDRRQVEDFLRAIVDHHD